MANDDPQQAPARRPLHDVIYYWGMAILAIGLVSAALIYAFTDDRDTDASSEIASGRMYEHNIELMGGKLAIYMDRFNDWFAHLWHGRPLAYTVAVLAIAIALVCFWIAHLTSVPIAHDAEQRRMN